MKKQPLTPERAILALPESNKTDGWKKARNLLKEQIKKSGVVPSSNSENKLMELSNKFWQDLFDELIRTKDNGLLAYSSRLRYQRIILTMGQEWLENDIIDHDSLPVIKVPPKHYRRQVVRLDQLKSNRPEHIHRLKDFEKVTQAFSDQFTGTTSSAEELSNTDVENSFILACLFSGFIQKDPVRVLTALTWQDVFIPDTQLVFIPYIEKGTKKRQGGFWFELAPLTRFIALCLRYRRKKHSIVSAQNVVIAPDEKKLRQRVSSVLGKICEKNQVSLLSVDNLIQLERFHLRLFLSSNIYLSVVTGTIRVNSLPRDQAIREFERMKTGKPPEINIELSIEDSQEKVVEEEEILEEIDQAAFELYSSVFDWLNPLLHSFIFAHSSRSKAILQTWADENENHTETPNRNIARLIRWLLEMKHKPQTKAAYWAAALRVLHYFPLHSIKEINQTELADFLDCDFAPSSLSLSKAAWRKVHSFLKKDDPNIPEIAWDRLRVKNKARTIRVITVEDFLKLVNSLPEYLSWAVRLSYWCGLRVSEVCRLRICDFDIDEGRPVLYIRPSKRAKRRKISLEHLVEKDLVDLRLLMRKRFGKSGDQAYLLVDHDGNPLKKKDVSTKISLEINRGLSGIKDSNKLRFHGLRGAAAESFYNICFDIRFVAQQLGHSLVQVTYQHYLHMLDLHAAMEINKWNNAIFNPDLHLPIGIVANYVGYTPNNMRLKLEKYNETHRDKPIQVKTHKELPGIVRSGRGKAKTQYISIGDAVRSLEWMNEDRK